MKFSIVTPAYNMERWIAETIESVLSQEGDFEIEYILVDDGSKDDTAAIAQSYAQRVADGSYPIRARSVAMQVISQENTGMYEAINRGFARATGDIFAWINADDLHLPGAYAAVSKAFSSFPEIEWLEGMVSVMRSDGSQERPPVARVYKQEWIKQGIYGMEAYFIVQEGTFWRKELWEKAGPIPAHFRSAGDYWLWLQMAQHAALWTLKYPTSSFRKREGQISKGVSKYKKEQEESRQAAHPDALKAKLFFSPQSRLAPRFAGFFAWLYPILFMHDSKLLYIEIREGKAHKAEAKSFTC